MLLAATLSSQGALDVSEALMGDLLGHERVWVMLATTLVWNSPFSPSLFWAGPSSRRVLMVNSLSGTSLQSSDSRAAGMLCNEVSVLK
jgi:hypothetical protein